MTTLAQVVHPDLLVPFSGLDWTDPSAVAAASVPLLNHLDRNRTLLGHLAAHVSVGQCERYDYVHEKLVLHDDSAGWRLELQVFLPGFFAWPHAHHRIYTSRILAGSYSHTLHGTDDALSDTIAVAAVAHRPMRIEKVGGTYTLPHRMIHSVTAFETAVSLIVRGPAITHGLVVTDRVGSAGDHQCTPDRAVDYFTAHRRIHRHIRQLVTYLDVIGLFL